MEKILILKKLDLDMNKEVTQELARVHAHLCGDGSVCTWKTKEKDRKLTAVTVYCNNNQKLLDNFRNDFSKIFGVKMKMRNNRDVSIRSIRIYTELTNRFGKFGSYQWRIHSSIKNAGKEIKLEWLKAFFEDEAYDEKRYNRLRIKCMNYSGIKDAKEMLDSLNIKSTLTGPNCDKSYYLTIPNFSSVVEFQDFVKEPARK